MAERSKVALNKDWKWLQESDPGWQKGTWYPDSFFCLPLMQWNESALLRSRPGRAEEKAFSFPCGTAFLNRRLILPCEKAAFLQSRDEGNRESLWPDLWEQAVAADAPAEDREHQSRFRCSRRRQVPCKEDGSGNRQIPLLPEYEAPVPFHKIHPEAPDRSEFEKRG